MSRRTLARRIAARRNLCTLAEGLSPFFDEQQLERVVRERAPRLARLIGDREVAAAVALASRPLQGEREDWWTLR